MRHLLAAALLPLLLTACGSGDAEPDATDTDSLEAAPAPSEMGAVELPADQHDEQEIVDHLGLVDDDGWWYYRRDGLDCEIVTVLTSASGVSMYADAGDVVASNPSRTAGVKITGGDTPTSECHAAITEALADLE